MALPYLRFEDVLKVAEDGARQEAEARLTEAAFIGWQVYAYRPRQEGERQKMTFKTWLQKLGIGRTGRRRLKLSKETVAAEAAAARENAKKVERAFSRRSGWI